MQSRDTESVEGQAQSSPQARGEPNIDIHDSRKRLATLLARGVIRVLSGKARHTREGGSGADIKSFLEIRPTAPN
jgi:hypothetical protein